MHVYKWNDLTTVIWLIDIFDNLNNIVQLLNVGNCSLAFVLGWADVKSCKCAATQAFNYHNLEERLMHVPYIKQLHKNIHSKYTRERSANCEHWMTHDISL